MASGYGFGDVRRGNRREPCGKTEGESTQDAKLRQITDEAVKSDEECRQCEQGA